MNMTFICESMQTYMYYTVLFIVAFIKESRSIRSVIFKFIFRYSRFIYFILLVRLMCCCLVMSCCSLCAEPHFNPRAYSLCLTTMYFQYPVFII